METPEDLRYTEDHEWVHVEGDTATIGITDYAQGELGDVVFVELPELGTEVEQGSVFGTIEAVKTVADLFAPVTGKVVDVNAGVGDDPALVNQFPYGDGWMVRLEVSNASEMESLMDAKSYRKHVGEDD